jgi:hypothetical protein
LERFDGTPVKGIIVYPALIEQFLHHWPQLRA